MPAGPASRILAVDDVPANLLTIKAILPPDEFSFYGVSDAQAAFALLKDQQFDLILLDVLLPGMNGFDLARKLRNDAATASVPLIFLTSLKDENEIVEAFEAGGVDFISKPFHKSELLLRLRTHLSLKSKNEALGAAAAELKASNQARDQFFSILAHDLKNPFAGFLSLLEELREHAHSLSTDDLTQSLSTMGQTAQNVHRLLENLLDWGRSQTESLSLIKEPLHASFLIEEALEPLEQVFLRKRISVGIEPTSSLVLCDRYTVVAVLRNLLSNASKFTNAGGQVRVRNSVRDGGLEVHVEDSGVGIPPERLSRLFRLENKASTPGTAKEPGTGLGLILCAEFAAKNGGELLVESVVGKGSTFTLRLPLALP